MTPGNEHLQDPEFDDEDDYYDDEEPDEFEEAMSNCGQTADGGCMYVGSEYCDWDCPFSKELWNRHTVRDERGRFSRTRIEGEEI